MDPEALKEQAKYDLIWSQCPSYRDCSPGEMFASFFLKHFQVRAEQTIIDFGCGTGRACHAFLAHNLNIILVDFSPHALDEQIRHLMALCPDRLTFIQACLWQLPKSLRRADWIYCCDVLEHIPENRIDQVLQGMAHKMQKGGYLSICLQEDLAGKHFGFPLHLTVKDKEWWLAKLSHHFTIAKTSSVQEGLYLNVCIENAKCNHRDTETNCIII